MSRTIAKGVLIGAVAALLAGLMGCDEATLTGLDPTGILKSDTYKWRFTLVRTPDDDPGQTDVPLEQATGRIAVVPWQ